MNGTQPTGIFSLHGVRYQVTDVARAAAFYTDHFGFKVEQQQLPAFASVRSESSGCCSMGPAPRDHVRCPAVNRSSRAGESSGPSRGGPARTNRRLKKKTVTFGNQIETGPGGRQIADRGTAPQ
jgi:glyoxylase I family protein